ncbi:DEAD/DEAH box helicase [Blastomonas fulva]|jgi:hypothetical protein|uniref:DEAD/DEAH box helicase n=1 Tax=Blastomonas fulva TaxID=1550728 RepID=UPI003D2AE794
MIADASNDIINKLLPHQRSVIETYSASVRYIYLTAPAGAGKTTTAVALALLNASRNPNARILMIAPARSLITQYADRLKVAGLNTKLIDRYAYRNLIDTNHSSAIWPGGITYGITTGLAAQSDVASTLFRTPWDLVVADEVRGPDTRNWAFLNQLLPSAAKALIITSTEHSHDTTESEAANVIWNLNELVDHTGQSLAPNPPSIRTINFKADLAREDSKLQIDKLPHVFADAAASSPAALERAIESYLARGSVEDEEQIDTDAPSNPHKFESDIRATLLSVEEHLAELIQDRKASALLCLLKNRIRDNPCSRICVVTRFISTAYYLSSFIETEGVAGLLAIGTSPIDDRRENMHLFVDSPPPMVLITTSGAVTSEPALRQVTDLIFYEAAQSSPQVDMIVGQANSIGRKDELRIYEMKPD